VSAASAELGIPEGCVVAVAVAVTITFSVEVPDAISRALRHSANKARRSALLGVASI